MNKKLAAIVLGASIMAVTACSSVSTTGSTVALQYSAGPFDTKAYEKCWSENQKSLSNDAADDYFYYPAGQRDFDFGGDGTGKDAPYLTSTTRDGQELKISGVVKFELNTECKEFTDAKGKKWPGGVLQYMHETFTAQRGAYGDEDGEMNDAWKKFLAAYLGAAVDRAVDNSSLNYNWQDLYQNPEIKTKWESTVKGEAEAVVKTLTQDVPIFQVKAVVLQKPDVGDGLKKGLSEKQEAILKSEAARMGEEAGKNFPGGLPAYLNYLREQAVNKAIENGQVKVIPIPQGSPVIINPN